MYRSGYKRKNGKSIFRIVQKIKGFFGGCSYVVGGELRGLKIDLLYFNFWSYYSLWEARKFSSLIGILELSILNMKLFTNWENAILIFFMEFFNFFKKKISWKFKFQTDFSWVFYPCHKVKNAGYLGRPLKMIPYTNFPLLHHTPLINNVFFQKNYRQWKFHKKPN